MSYKSAEEQKKEYEAKIQSLQEENEELKNRVDEIQNSRNNNAENNIIAKIASMFKELDKKIKDIADSYSKTFEEAGVKLGKLEDKIEQQDELIREISRKYDALVKSGVLVADGHVEEVFDNLEKEQSSNITPSITEEVPQVESIVEPTISAFDSAQNQVKDENEEQQVEESISNEEPTEIQTEKDEEQSFNSFDSVLSPADESAKEDVAEQTPESTPNENSEDQVEEQQAVIDSPLSNMLDSNDTPSFEQDTPFTDSSKENEILPNNEIEQKDDNKEIINSTPVEEVFNTETITPSEEVVSQVTNTQEDNKQEFTQQEILTPTSIQAASLASKALNEAIISGEVPGFKTVDLNSLNESIAKKREEQKTNTEEQSAGLKL